jgi:hypothetical protein
MVAAQHNEQVAHHRGLPLLVELHDVFSLRALEGEFDHADRPVDDLLARNDDRGGLLAAEHRLGDFWGVGEADDLARVR